MAIRFIASLIAVGTAALSLPGQAATPISLQDSFRIGSGGNVLCTAQAMPTDRALRDMFDRGYSIVCRDASIPVGRLYVLRLGSDPAARLAALRQEKARCGQSAPNNAEGVGPVELSNCRLVEADVGYQVYAKRQGNSLYVAEGLAAYQSALQLGLRSLIADRAVPGEVSVATTGMVDPIAFARVQAGSLSPQQARAEAYRRNNSGDYAEAAEFFATMRGNATAQAARPEALANEAVQKSNLGSYVEADVLFAQAEQLVGQDPVVTRQLRNYRVMHLLNQGRLDEAYRELSRPMPETGASAAIRELVIDDETATRLSSETAAARALGASSGLSIEDKVQILDAQALQLRGSALRVEGKQAEAAAALRQAQSQMVATRDGRVAATLWMQSQIFAELAGIVEASGDLAGAERNLRAGIAIIEADYPGSSTLLSAKGRLASFYARTGRDQQALAMFREMVANNNESGNASPAFRNILGSYFALLTRPAAPSGAASDLFSASQLLLRPGVAQTQAILARELSGGSDEAARLFRQSISITRDIERIRVELGRLQAGKGAPADAAKLGALQDSLREAQADQLVTQAKLAEFPRYRALANATISIEELQAMLRPREAYYKMVVLGGGTYAIFVTPQSARAFRIPASAASLDRQVDALRATISTEENGQLVTFPFDVAGAHQLFQALFGQVTDQLAGVSNLIFEPDGAMLRLPPNLLVMDRKSVETYQARASRPNDDGFDFRGVAWLGRDRDISTSVSAPAFRDLRRAAPSRAQAQYIGFGQNQPADAFFLPANSIPAATDNCGWSLAAWGRPISGSELQTARQALGGAGAEVITGRDFTDAAIKARSDLNQYRIVHFATHGMLAPPRPECPTRPALMTSFGGAQSDGLLSFGEIFDLRLDADVVILSACDTAGRASSAANREAGLTSGGEFALDGLVRAFVGAGGRLVVASHWPVPDDYDATQRLISGMFAAPPGSGTASALRAAQRSLMDDAATSHPFYWAGFAVVGDGAAPLIRPGAVKTASVR